MAQHLYLSRFTELLYIRLAQSVCHFTRHLSWSIHPFTSQTSLTHSKLLPQGFFKLFQDFIHLVSFLCLIFIHFMFWNLGFGIFEKFWGFSKFLSFCWNFGMGFKELILKTSCIASHEHYNSIIMHLDVCKLIVC